MIYFIFVKVASQGTSSLTVGAVRGLKLQQLKQENDSDVACPLHCSSVPLFESSVSMLQRVVHCTFKSVNILQHIYFLMEFKVNAVL